MYRQGLGDCFLLTFNPGGDEKHILIDCGTLGATTTGIKLPDVVADIDKTTNGHLHLVVATHQHQDHLSGFPKIADQFSPGKNKQIDHVWLAWTEDPNDQLAKQLGKTRDDMAIAVKSALQAMRRHLDKTRSRRSRGCDFCSRREELYGPRPGTGGEG